MRIFIITALALASVSMAVPVPVEPEFEMKGDLSYYDTTDPDCVEIDTLAAEVEPALSFLNPAPQVTGEEEDCEDDLDINIEPAFQPPADSTFTGNTDYENCEDDDAAAIVEPAVEIPTNTDDYENCEEEVDMNIQPEPALIEGDAAIANIEEEECEDPTEAPIVEPAQLVDPECDTGEDMAAAEPARADSAGNFNPIGEADFAFSEDHSFTGQNLNDNIEECEDEMK